MAEVYGNLGNETIELNNAATEATLKAILSAVQAQSKGSKSNKKERPIDLAQFEKSLKKLTQELNRAADSQTSLSREQKKLADIAKREAASRGQSTQAIDQESRAREGSIRSQRQANESLNKTSASMKQLGKQANGVLGRLTEFGRGIQGMGDSISSATSVFSGLVKEIPLVGGALGSLMDMIAQAAESTQKGFMATASVGANFGGSITEMVRYSTEAGLTIDKFAGVIQANSAGVAQLANSTAEGAKRLAALSTSMKRSGLQDQLAYLGFSLEDINSNMASFSNILAKGGVNVREMTNDELVNLTADYMKNLDGVSKLTGQSRKDLEKQREERQRDAKFRVLERRIDPKDRNRLQAMFDMIGPEFEKGAKDLMMGFADTPEAQAMLAFQGDAAREFQKMGQDMRRTGRLSVRQVDGAIQSLVKGANKITKSELVNVLGGPLADKYGSFVVANMDIERLKGKSLAEVEAVIEEEIKKRQEAAEANNPAKLLEAQRKIAETSNKMQEELAKLSGPLTSVLNMLLSVVQKLIPNMDELPGKIQAFIDNIKKWINDPIGQAGGLFSRLVDSIWEGVKKGVQDLVDRAIEIGKRIGTGFISNLPDWMVKFFSKNQTEKELKLTEAEDKLKKLQADPTAKKEDIEKAKAEVAAAKTEVLNERREKLTVGRQNQIDRQLTQAKEFLAIAQKDKNEQLIKQHSENIARLTDMGAQENQRAVAAQAQANQAQENQRVIAEAYRAMSKEDLAKLDRNSRDLVQATIALDEATSVKDKAAFQKEIERLKSKGAKVEIPAAIKEAIEAARRQAADDAAYESPEEIQKALNKLTNTLAIDPDAARREAAQGEYTESQEETNRLLKNLPKAIATAIDPDAARREEIQGEYIESQDETNRLLDNLATVVSNSSQTQQDNTTAVVANTKETKAASTCELDYSSPQALFNSFVKVMTGGGQPGAAGTTTTGAVSGTAPSGSEVQVGPGGIVLPSTGTATSLHGLRPDPFGSGRQQMHEGVDIAAALGTDILAPEGGTARVKKQLDKAGKLTGWGNYIEIVDEQGKVIHRLAHLAESTIKDGEKVLAGQKIAKMGSSGSSTGSHLHWEMFRDGKNVDPFKQMGLNVAKGQNLSRTQMAQAAPASGLLGSLSQKYESGTAGSMAVGRDKSGGTSYGKYQISSKVGAMNDFLKILQKNDPEAYNRLMASGSQDAGTEGKFAQEWKKLVGEGKIQGSEREFAVDKIFKPAMAGLKDQDLSKMISGNKGLQEMMFSMAIQHGPGGAPAILNKVFKKGMTPQQLAEAAYAERGAEGGKRYFSKSSEAERAGVVSRFGREKQDVLALLGQPGGVIPSTAVAAGPATRPAGGTTPTGAQVTAAVTPPAGGTTPNVPGPAAPAAGNASPITNLAGLMEDLNSNVKSLVSLTNQQLEISRRTLSATRNNNSDLYSATT